ncbi:MAG: lysoplasmalogenase [Treponema sp.]|jgi:uncharacterized membrane protein YhhN|nr:lysoplasmalogenase [Treponema sp.]
MITKIILSVFIAVSIFHLIVACLNKPVLQGISKLCIVPPLLAAYLVTAENLVFTVVLAAVFGWAGDALLLKIDNKKFFQAGLLCFLAGHVCYAISLLHFAEDLNITALVISGAVSLALAVIVFFVIRPSADMRIPVIAYELFIMAMVLSAFQLFIQRFDYISVLVFGGSIAFLVSDSILAYFSFRRLPKYGNLAVMLPYIAAQGCIIIGLALL